MKRVFINWQQECTRSSNISKHFDSKLIYIHPFKTKGSSLLTVLRYVISVFITFFVLLKERPKYVFVINLPFPLTISIRLYSKILNYKYIIDSHSGPFEDRRWDKYRNVYKRLSRKALLNINTCRKHKEMVEEWGGKSFIISDVPLVFKKDYPLIKVENKSITVVCSFNYDEPIDEIWEAARITKDVTYYITGNYKKLLDKKYIDNLPENIKLLGFIPIDDYYSYLRSINAVMVLTTDDNTMQRGAYEALAFGQPIITSDWEVLRDSFGKAALYVDNTPVSIAKAVNEIINDNKKFKETAAKQKQSRIEHFNKTKEEINNYIKEN